LHVDHQDASDESLADLRKFFDGSLIMNMYTEVWPPLKRFFTLQDTSDFLAEVDRLAQESTQFEIGGHGDYGYGAPQGQVQQGPNSLQFIENFDEEFPAEFNDVLLSISNYDEGAASNLPMFSAQQPDFGSQETLEQGGHGSYGWGSLLPDHWSSGQYMHGVGDVLDAELSLLGMQGSASFIGWSVFANPHDVSGQPPRDSPGFGSSGMSPVFGAPGKQ
jgi:hypothetical protein